MNALYLIFKFAVAHRQSFDDDMRALPHIQACRKQTRTNLNLCMTPFERCDFTLATGGQVYAKGTATRHVLGRGFFHTISFLWVEDITTKFSDHHWPVEAREFLAYPGLDFANRKARARARSNKQRKQINKVAHDVFFSSFVCS